MSRLPGIEAPRSGLVEVPAAPGHRVLLLRAVATALEVMLEAAARDGVTILPVSGFRDLERQTRIWNRKHATLRDAGLDDRAAVGRILEWSAPPGWSRHHWGTDVDLVQGPVSEDEVRLEAADWDPGRACAEAGAWLEEKASLYGFLRPYDAPRGGFRPEPWHWSFAPIARARLLEVARLDWRGFLASRPFAAAEVLLEDLDDGLARFVFGVAPALLAADPWAEPEDGADAGP